MSNQFHSKSAEVLNDLRDFLIHVSTFLKDWREGDFQLSATAKIHVNAINERIVDAFQAYEHINSGLGALVDREGEHKHLAWMLAVAAESQLRDQRNFTRFSNPTIVMANLVYDQIPIDKGLSTVVQEFVDHMHSTDLSAPSWLMIRPEHRRHA